MELSDPDRSRAVLIGVHTYDRLPDLPAVQNNLADLAAVFSDGEIWGLPDGHCRVVAQPADPGAILSAVRETGPEALDTLVVYYAGHGLVDQHSDELYLALPGTDPDLPGTALAYDHLRRVIRDPRIRARRKVVILDCCYSGRALEGGMSAAMADLTVTDGTHVLTASGPTQRAWSPPDETHTAFTGELLTVLDDGIPGGPGLLTMETIYLHVRGELRAKSRPLPQQQNRDGGSGIAIARNRAVSGSGPRPPRVVRRRRRPLWDVARSWSRATRIRAVTAAAVVLALVAGLATFLVLDRPPPVAAVPAGLRDCHAGGPVPEGADAAYACRDGAGRRAAVEVYPDRRTTDEAYERAIGNADVTTSTGDCGNDEDGEHRYPVTGPAAGRVLCWTAEGTTTVLWSDNSAYTIARVTAPSVDVRALRDSWFAAVAPAAAFPTPAERGLIDLPVAGGCRRAGIAEVDDFAGAIGGVRCDETGGAGAQSVSYFAFDSQPKLDKAMTAHIPADKDPKGKGCQDGEATRFTDGRRYDVRGVFLGVLLCHPAPDGNLIMEWSVDALLVAGRAVGSDATDLAAWWRVNRGPPLPTVVDAVNRNAGFPSPAEEALRNRIPEPSRRLCMRASGEFRTEHVGTYPVTAGVVCGPTSGPAIVFYYQFTSLADLRARYGPPGSGPGSCLATATTVTGESAYTRGRTQGRLQCNNDNGYLARRWTDERRLIYAIAFQGRDARAMSDWWDNDAGPL